METSQFAFSQNVLGYEYALSRKNYAYHVLGFSRNTVSPFSEMLQM
jgi:hypothetical protein